ncbi:MAG: LLM class flavin-dependent oxidoreductase [Candidatus Rokuibacteriota bacterium]|nr:MAG: LLM class flavin-dependent oxidoreductase [Candidatus Rokubacteria bacterium]
MTTERNATMRGGNRFKLAVFGSNCSSGRAATKVPERWENTFEDNVRLARMSDEIGIECMVPIGRWKGYGGATNFEGSTFETITWACGLLAATRYLTVFGTVHVAIFPPVLAAKQIVTADHIGQGRFGLNIVCGWNQDEFDMFGLEQDPHDDRYARGREWLEILTRMWSEEEPFDYAGRYYQLRGVTGRPLPWGGRRPILMNAGNSVTGRTFGARHCDMVFDQPHYLDAARDRIVETRRVAGELGREIQVFTSGAVVCRPTQNEADEYFRYFAVEHRDDEAIDTMFKLYLNPANQRSMTREQLETLRARYGAGYGGLLAVGDPDTVANEFKKLADAGFDGFCFSFVAYNDELPYFAQEVIPRLERMGLRKPFRP